jgi:hypothetical protein
MTDNLTAVMRQRGKVVALFVVCGTAVALVHPESAAPIFAALAVPVGALAGVEAWAARGQP